MLLAQLEAIDFSDQIWWYTVRVTGIVSVFTIAGGITTGLVTSGRFFGVKPTIPWLVDLHQLFSSITFVLLAAHMAGLYLDEFTSFTVRDLLIPFESNFANERLWIGVGTLGWWAFVIVDLSSRNRKRLPKKLWHSIHLLVFPLLAAGLAHGYFIGSDTDNPFFVLAVVIALALIVLLSFARLLRR